ncbi:unnamed protein product [Sphenostylis stenocarpa]|uniref:Uncharacterized protein n=1 Tax=Sphenostylis stenocarpa TaxID=92480 RepID=A0AA86VEQ4_9FABA|nr:unnamed protein product [Sphenostylis stenocarpa]
MAVARVYNVNLLKYFLDGNLLLSEDPGMLSVLKKIGCSELGHTQLFDAQDGKSNFK